VFDGVLRRRLFIGVKCVALGVFFGVTVCWEPR
jgi:hypothetical protein